MGECVFVYGKSGSGKSRSLINFGEDEIFLVNTIGKRLPFRSKFKYEIKTDDFSKIANGLRKMPTKTAVIDDSGYLMTNAFMRGHSNTGAGNNIFSFYNSMADSFWNLIQFVVHGMPDNKIVYFIMHEDKSDNGDIKPKTIGKVLDEKVCVEGMFTIVLRSECIGGEYIFHTRTNGFDVTKTPMGMFDAPTISNDLKMVDDTIREYYNIKTQGDNTNA